MDETQNYKHKQIKHRKLLIITDETQNYQHKQFNHEKLLT